MTDPTLLTDENTNWLWKLISFLTTALAGMCMFLWKRQDRAIERNAERITAIETTYVTRDIFNAANEALRREFREETKSILEELRHCSASVSAEVKNTHDAITTRIDNFIIKVSDK